MSVTAKTYSQTLSETQLSRLTEHSRLCSSLFNIISAYLAGIEKELSRLSLLTLRFKEWNIPNLIYRAVYPENRLKWKGLANQCQSPVNGERDIGVHKRSSCFVHGLQIWLLETADCGARSATFSGGSHGWRMAHLAWLTINLIIIKRNKRTTHQASWHASLRSNIVCTLQT